MAKARVFRVRITLQQQKIHRHVLGGTTGAGWKEIELHEAEFRKNPSAGKGKL
jgi:hypothetical protein